MRMVRFSACGLGLFLAAAMAIAPVQAQKHVGGDRKLLVAPGQAAPLAKDGPSKGPTTMAEGGIQRIRTDLGATVRVDEARLTPLEETEYGGWKKLGLSLGHFADIVAQERARRLLHGGLARELPVDAWPGRRPPAVGLDGRGASPRMLWLDAHPDLNTPEATRIGSLGGMPVAVATGRALSIAALNRMIAGAVRGLKARQ